MNINESWHGDAPTISIHLPPPSSLSGSQNVSLNNLYLVVFTAHKRSSGKVMFLHLSVSHSVHREGCIPACNGRGCVSQHAMGCVCPWVSTHIPPGRHLPWRPPPHTPLGRHPLPFETTTEADGTHPTGMHSFPLLLNSTSYSKVPARIIFNSTNDNLNLVKYQVKRNQMA